MILNDLLLESHAGDDHDGNEGETDKENKKRYRGI